MTKPLTLDALMEAAERVLTYPPERIEGMARRSALHTVTSQPGATVSDVVRRQGLSQENAERALAQLVSMGAIRLRLTGGYEATGGIS